jgi:hypothetical protein
MKTIAVIVALAACTTQQDTGADAGAIALPDAQPQISRGCSMPTLPDARSETPAPGDTVKSGLLIEIEDMIVGQYQPLASYLFSGADFILESGAATCADGVWTVGGSPATFTHTIPVRFNLPNGTIPRLNDVLFTVDARSGGAYTAKVRKRLWTSGGPDLGVTDLASETGSGSTSGSYAYINLDSSDVGSLLPYTWELDVTGVVALVTTRLTLNAASAKLYGARYSISYPAPP